jgi:glycosyltransferase involved in cell wall biosynthesis
VRLALCSDVNILVGGLSFRSTILGHITSKSRKKIFVSEGRFASQTISQRFKDFFETYFCKSQIYLAIGANARLYFNRLGVPNDKIDNFAYYYSNENIKHSPALGSTRNALRVVFVGNDARRKGIDILINVAAMRPQYRFTIVGRIDETDIWTASTPKNIDVLGWISPEKIHSVLINNEVLILPSRVEPYGCVIQEAIDAGLASICSPFAGARSLASTPDSKVLVAGENTPEHYVNMLDNLAELQKSSDAQQRPVKKQIFLIERGVRNLISIMDRMRSES